MLGLERRWSIPTSSPVALRGGARRTALVRGALAFSLVAALVAAVVVAKKHDVRHAPLVTSGSKGIVVLDLSASVYEGGFYATVRKLVKTDERAGLVVFSDAAYELLPPGSPGREFQSLLRFFKVSPTELPPPNPWEEFRAGTRISEGLNVARAALRREGAQTGTIILISDLEILPHEIIQLIPAIADLRREGFTLRILPLAPSDEKRALIEQLMGRSSFLSVAASDEAVRTAHELSLTARIPWTFVLVGVLLIVLLTANEWKLSRLTVGR